MTSDNDGFVFESPAEEREREERETIRAERIDRARFEEARQAARELASGARVFSDWLSSDYPEPPSESEAQELLVELAEHLGQMASAFPDSLTFAHSAKTLLLEALSATEARGKVYGESDKRLRDVATMWSVLLGGRKVSAQQVALCMSALKMVRLVESPQHTDSWIDGVAYLALGGQAAGVRGEQ